MLADWLFANVHANAWVRLLAGLVILLASGRLLGHIFERKLGQPSLVGEVLAGMLLAVLGFGSDASGIRSVVAPAVVNQISLLANIGVLFFMFVVGLEFDLSALTQKSRAALVISQVSILFPLSLALLISPWLYARYGAPEIRPIVFSSFLGLALSVTALPVLGRIMIGRNVQTSPLGRLVLLCAAADDVSAWCLLALVSGLSRGRFIESMATPGLTALYGLLMVTWVRRQMRRLSARVDREQAVSPAVVTIVLCCVLISAAATELIGIHFLFGAFVMGMMLPHDGLLAAALRRYVEEQVLAVWLPLFFVCSGLKTHLSLLANAEDWIACAAICLVATLGKLGGCYVAARSVKIPHFDSLGIGALMNARGLVGLVIADLGLQMGVFSQKTFAMLVVMALVTTLTATPLLDYCLARARSAWLPADWSSDSAFEVAGSEARPRPL